MISSVSDRRPGSSWDVAKVDLIDVPGPTHCQPPASRREPYDLNPGLHSCSVARCCASHAQLRRHEAPRNSTRAGMFDDWRIVVLLASFGSHA
jgi:hypothetical protein